MRPNNSIPAAFRSFLKQDRSEGWSEADQRALDQWLNETPDSRKAFDAVNREAWLAYVVAQVKTFESTGNADSIDLQPRPRGSREGVRCDMYLYLLTRNKGSI